MPVILTATQVPVSPVFSGVYNPAISGPIASQAILQAETTNARPKVNENAGRADLTARFGGGGYAVVHGLTLSAGSGLTLNIAAGQAQINSPVTYPGGTASLTNSGRNWIWISQAGAITVVFNSLTPPAGAQALVGSALTAAGSISSVDTSGVLLLIGGMLKRHTGDTTLPGDTPPGQLQFWNFGGSSKLWFWNGLVYTDMSGIATPVSIANGGTGASTALAARANLGAPVFGHLNKAITTSTTLSTSETTDYSSIRITNGGGLAAGWILTIPAATAVEGQAWEVYNNSGFPGRIQLSSGSTTIYLNDNQKAHVTRQNADLRLQGRDWPRYQTGTAYIFAGTHAYSQFEEVTGDLFNYSPSAGAATAQYASAGALENRGAAHVALNDDSSGGALTLRTGGASTDPRYETLLLKGEMVGLTIDGAGSVVRQNTRPYTGRAAKNFTADADYTLTPPEYLAFIVEMTDTTPFLTAARDVTLPPVDDKLWLFRNKSAQPLRFKTSGGAGITLRPGTQALGYGDGTDILPAEPQSLTTSGPSEVAATQSTTVTVANTTTETTLLGTLFGSATLPANLLRPGRSVRVRAWGVLGTDAAAHTLTLKTYFGATALGSTGALTLATGLANRLWDLELLLTCRTAGASGTVFAQGYFRVMPAASTTAQQIAEMANTATITIDTTASQAFDVKSTWGAGVTASDTLSLTNMSLEVLN